MIQGEAGLWLLGLKGGIKRLLRPQRFNWDDIQTAFVVSTGRTATKFLARLLTDCFRGVEARHEPQPDLFGTATACVRGHMAQKRANARIRRARAHVCEKLHVRKCDVYIEANNNLAYLLASLREVFPCCKIVHLVRDGRDLSRSLYSKTVRSIDGRPDGALFMSPEDRRRRLQAPDLPDDPYRERWAEMSRFQRMCWYWLTKDRMIRDFVAGDALARTVKFETLFDESASHSGLWEIIDFLDIEDRMISRKRLLGRLAEKENVTGEYLLPHWREWTEAQRRQFNEIAGKHLLDYGYAW